MDLSARRSMFGRPASLRPIGLLLLVALLIAVVVALAVGSYRPLPAPFGLARNGADRDEPRRRHLSDRSGNVAVARPRSRRRLRLLADLLAGRDEADVPPLRRAD